MKRSIGYGVYGDYGLTSFGDEESARAELAAAESALAEATATGDEVAIQNARDRVAFARTQVSQAVGADAAEDKAIIGGLFSFLNTAANVGSKFIPTPQQPQPPQRSGGVAPVQSTGYQSGVPAIAQQPKSNLGLAIGIAAGLGILAVVVILATRKPAAAARRRKK